MDTVIIQIGNSDNKLTQIQWANFIVDIDTYLTNNYYIHFNGHSNPTEYWNNHCWVIQTREVDRVRKYLEHKRKEYKQDSIALTIGETEFV